MGASKKPNLATLKAMQRNYDYIAAHPGCTTNEMVAEFKVTVSTLRNSLLLLRDGGYITKENGPRRLQGQTPSSYRVTKKERPTVVPPHSKKLRPTDAECSVKRKFGPAQQIGMVRDALVAALFGPSRVVGA